MIGSPLLKDNRIGYPLVQRDVSAVLIAVAQRN
jgi:hypothetical protein